MGAAMLAFKTPSDLLEFQSPADLVLRGHSTVMFLHQYMQARWFARKRLVNLQRFAAEEQMRFATVQLQRASTLFVCIKLEHIYTWECTVRMQRRQQKHGEK